ncbi:hypothetical protein [Mycobacterium sp. P7213]|uniref:hypothetical protein n=1 Tax=Mycobacterium sp. P7213 TaxID=2478465 RepID=UPI000F632D00
MHRTGEAVASTGILVAAIRAKESARDDALFADPFADKLAPGSVLLYDVVGKSLQEAPSMAPLLQSMAQQGSPWLFGTDAPGELAERHGWSAVVTDVAEPGNMWNRWFPSVTAGAGPDAPRGYFVEAQR